jgi:DNA-binding transcriptional regulator WhiA
MSIPQFTSLVNQKEFVYLLGFLWADGYISKSNNSIEINIIKDDYESIQYPLSEHIKWNIFYKQRKQNGIIFGKPQIKIQKSIPELKLFLLEHGYANKSGGSPTSILNAIPDNIKHYWWRGYFDGDGSIAISKNGCKNLSFWSVMTQDWTELSTLMSSLNIGFKIYLYQRKCGNSSSLTITRKQNIIIFRNYIYPDKKYDFGLKRKFDKFLLI